MAIVFPSKTGKKRSLLLDAFRILAWEEFRSDNKEQYKKLKFRGYEIFEPEWLSHEIHKMSYVEIIALAGSLEYKESELLNLRSTYYAKKGNFPRTSNSNNSSDSSILPETVTQLASAVDDSSDSVVDDSVASVTSNNSQGLPDYDPQPF